MSTKALRVVVPLGATARMAALNYEPVGSTPAQLAAIIESDTAKWRRIVKETNYKPEE
jgi:tripartite-type tricarboxylate transporter receptor subunit TctC